MDSSKIKEYISPLNMDGLHGRLLKMPGEKKGGREILIIYGHHASIERMSGFVDLLSRYGNVTMPDLPGFGGMQPFYKIGIKPSLDAYADYIAAFMKLAYKRKKVTIVSVSYGVSLVIKTLQKHPELQDRVDSIVSISGFCHHEDFGMPKKYRYSLQALSWFGSRKLPSLFLKYAVFRPFFIRIVYRMIGDTHGKMKTLADVERNSMIDFAVHHWTSNDVRTWMQTINGMFHMDLCDQKLPTQIHHVRPPADIYLNPYVAEQHLRIIFDDFVSYDASLPNHAPSIIATAEEIEPFFPKKLQKLLAT